MLGWATWHACGEQQHHTEQGRIHCHCIRCRIGSGGGGKAAAWPASCGGHLQGLEAFSDAGGRNHGVETAAGKGWEGTRAWILKPRSLGPAGTSRPCSDKGSPPQGCGSQRGGRSTHSTVKARAACTALPTTESNKTHASQVHQPNQSTEAGTSFSARARAVPAQRAQHSMAVEQECRPCVGWRGQEQIYITVEMPAAQLLTHAHCSGPAMEVQRSTQHSSAVVPRQLRHASRAAHLTGGQRRARRAGTAQMGPAQQPPVDGQGRGQCIFLHILTEKGHAGHARCAL